MSRRNPYAPKGQNSGARKFLGTNPVPGHKLWIKQTMAEVFHQRDQIYRKASVTILHLKFIPGNNC